MSIRTRIAVAFLFVLAACAAPAAAVDLRYGIKEPPLYLGNPYADRSTVALNLSSALFDGLTRFDKSGTLVPALASAWKKDSPTVWRFTLRRGVAFSNGEPLTADAVVATLDWLKTADGARTVTGDAVKGVAAAEAEDERTVLVQTTQPDPILPQRLAAVMIAAPHAWADLGPDAYARAPAGTGPFTLKSWAADKITLAANPDSWRPPKVDRLILMTLPDKAARLKALLAGQIDIDGNVDIDQIDALNAAEMLTDVAPARSVMAIALRQDGEGPSALKDVRVRRALNHAVDKVDLNERLLRRLGAPAGQPAARQVFGYEPDVRAYPFDPEKAKALLAEASAGGGLKLRIDAVVDRAPADRAIVDGLASALAAVGVVLESRTITLDAWATASRTGAWGDADGFLTAFDASSTGDAASVLEELCKAPWSACDAALVAKIAMADTEMDSNRRATLLSEIARTLHDNPPAIFLTEQFDLFALSRDVEGFTVANRVPVYEAMSLRK